MAYTKSGSPFLYDESSDDVVGVKDRDGGESLFLKLVGNEVQAGNGVQTVILPEIANYASVRAYSGPQTAYYVRGVASIFDGGAGVFRVDASDTTSADNGGAILVDAAGRRWKREYVDGLDLRWFGAVLDGATDCTAATYRALSVGGKIHVMGPCRIEHAMVLSLTGTNKLTIGNDTHLVFSPHGRFLINSNQLADGSRFEITGANVSIKNGRFSEINGTLGRYNVYGTLSGNGCSKVVLDYIEIDGANGAGMHFRNNCSNVTVNCPAVINTKADGLHIQRGCKKFRIITPYFEANEDDCIGLVSHGRNDGYEPVQDVEIVGGYYGAQANGAVGSGVAIIGARDVRITHPRCVANGLSGIRIADWKSATEGSYAPANIEIISPVCVLSGQTISGAAGLVKDGITIVNARNVKIIAPDVDRPANCGVVVSEASIDVQIIKPKIREAGSRGLWVSAAFKTDAHILDLATQFGDSRYSAPAQLGCEYLRIEDPDIDGSETDGFYLDGTSSVALQFPVLRNIKVTRSNMGNAAGKYGAYISYTNDMDLIGINGGSTGSATAVSTVAFVSADYVRIDGLANNNVSHTYPVRMRGTIREFWNSATPAGAPAVGPAYAPGEIIWNSNPGAGTAYWICTTGGGAGTWAAK